MGLFTKLRSKSKSKSNQTMDQFKSSTTAAETNSAAPEATTTTVQNAPATQKSLPSPVEDKRRDSDAENDENVDDQDPKKKDKKDKKDNGVNVRRNILATVSKSTHNYQDQYHHLTFSALLKSVLRLVVDTNSWFPRTSIALSAVASGWSV